MTLTGCSSTKASAFGATPSSTVSSRWPARPPTRLAPPRPRSHGARFRTASSTTRTVATPARPSVS
uniref:Uncharacterized protein n=1 Tax=uncultured marine virus TaxID=186617 RepID=A0A0F7L817_9VIRU|nr:hypothetical protein [uncultured marine virus]